MANLERPSFTVSSDLSEFIPEQGSVYIYGTSVEGRSFYADHLRSVSTGVLFTQITMQATSSLTLHRSGFDETIMLKDRANLAGLFSSFGKDHCYLDITGIAHHVWAPLLRAALSVQAKLTVIYIEPVDYRPNPNPREDDIFDLSSRINGIAPIPGFASLVEPPEESVCFVPLLGFEGARFAYLIEHVQPPGGKIVPIIGVPGFRAEYPFHTYQGNRTPLLETRSWRNVRFARANCPFTLMGVLQDVAASHASDYLKIAPIGTKPHALGAVLFILSSRANAELVYDHPIRRPDRTSGSAKVLRYPLHDFQITNSRTG